MFATILTPDILSQLAPEIVLIAAATWIYIAGAFPATRKGTSWFALGALAVTLICVLKQDGALNLFDGAKATVDSRSPVTVDLWGHMIRWLVLLTGFLLLALSWRSGPDESPEYTGSLLLTLAGLMLVAVAQELVLLFVGLELISIPTYVLLFLGRRDGPAQEAGAKYFYLSILSSALLLFGFSYLYGVAGSTHLNALKAALADPETAGKMAWFAKIGVALVFLGLGFRLTVVPLQFYAPDVYQGTSHPNAGFLATLPKLAGIAGLVRIVGAVLPSAALQHLAWQLCVVLALATMTYGNILALWQDQLRRMMAYSSIAHGGYLLIGLAVGFASSAAGGSVWVDGFSACLLYSAVYVLGTLGVFAALAYLGRRGQEVERIDEIAGLAKSFPGVAAAMALCLFSLTGIPPLAGFWGKFALFSGAISVDVPAPGRTWFIVLAVVGVLNAAISAGYYLRVIAALYFRPALSKPAGQGTFGSYLCLVFCSVLVVAIGLMPRSLFDAMRPTGPAFRETVQVTAQQTPPVAETR